MKLFQQITSLSIKVNLELAKTVDQTLSENINTPINETADVNNKEEEMIYYQDERGVIHLLESSKQQTELQFEATDALFLHLTKTITMIPQKVEFTTGNLLEQTVNLLKNGNLVWFADLKVNFTDEDGIDLGGVRREYLSELIGEVVSSNIFEGSDAKYIK